MFISFSSLIQCLFELYPKGKIELSALKADTNIFYFEIKNGKDKEGSGLYDMKDMETMGLEVKTDHELSLIIEQVETISAKRIMDSEEVYEIV